MDFFTEKINKNAKHRTKRPLLLLFLFVAILICFSTGYSIATLHAAGPLAPVERDESGDIITPERDDEDDRRSYRWPRDFRREIDELDNDRVENLPIPILFGVSLEDLTPNFGDPRAGGARQHEGLDIIAPRGTPIISPTEAVVVRVGRGINSGYHVYTVNPGGERFVYMHLDEIADIDEGDEIEIGDLIGYVGNTGNARGGVAHLHFEIQDGRDPLDPFFRITREFDTEKKMQFLENILSDIDDEDDLIELIAEKFLGELITARTGGARIPEDVRDALPENLQSASIPMRDLTVGARGTEVMVLQSILMKEGYLDISSPTGYFGPLTERALQAYQRANNISPASGYYGPLTRASLGSISSRDDNTQISSDREELLSQIAALSEQVKELQAQISGL